MRASDALSSGTCGRLPAASMSPLARQNDQIGAPAEGLYGVTICAQIDAGIREVVSSCWLRPAMSRKVAHGVMAAG